MASLGVSIAVALFLSATGIALFALRPNRLVNAWIASVLLLQAASTAAYAALASATNGADALAYAHMGVWASIPLPFVTLCLVHAALPLRARTARAWIGALGLATVIALIAQLVAPRLYVERVSPFLQGYTLTSASLFYFLAVVAALAQAYAVWHAERASRGADEIALRQAGSVGFAFALLPLHTSAFFLSYSILRAEPLLSRLYLFRVVGTLVASVLILIALRRLFARMPRPTRRASAWLLGALLLLGILDGVVAGGATAGRPALAILPGYERSVVLLRVGFAVILAAAALRFGTADLGARERRHAHAIVHASVAGLVVVALAGISIVALGANIVGASVASLTIIALFAGGRAPLRAFSEGVTRRLLLRPDDPRAIAERARTYAAAIAACRDGGSEGDKLLAQMRDDLGITLQEHALLVSGVASRDEERYQRVQTLGRGTTAQVELAVDEIAGRRVVIKRFTGLRNPAAVLLEARSLAAVRHPRVIPFLEVDRRGDEVHLVLAYAEGGSARQRLDKDGPMDPAAAVRLTQDLLEGLEALHATGIVHGDVKVENLLLDAEGRGMLGDFGSARFVAPDLVDATLVGTGAEGSLSTLSPEGIRGATPLPERDVYATGALLYRLLTGEHYVALDVATVFEARERILLDPPRLPHPKVPARLEAVIRKALAKKPGDRYRSALEMRDALGGPRDL